MATNWKVYKDPNDPICEYMVVNENTLNVTFRWSNSLDSLLKIDIAKLDVESYESEQRLKHSQKQRAIKFELIATGDTYEETLNQAKLWEMLG